MCIGVALGLAVAALLWKRRWHAVLTLVLTVPGGMLLGEWLKLLVHRPRPYTVGPLVDWAGYSFPSGHTIGATLLYGLLALTLLRVLPRRRWQVVAVVLAAGLILVVGFSRIALGAHYFSDVIAAIFFGLMWLAVCPRALRVMRQRVACRRAVAAADLID